MSLLRPPTGTLRSLCLLSTCFLLLRLAASQEPADSSASGYTCTPECGPGYECNLGTCVLQCPKDCSNEAKQLVCGSNGVTYNSPCELEKERCEQMKPLNQEYVGACITLSPPPAQHCKAKQTEFDYRNFEGKCSIDVAFAKKANGTLTQSDIIDCFTRPQCQSNNHYIKKQCSIFFPEFCWCSTPDGHVINGTFQKVQDSAGYCDNRASCVVDNITYADGEVFTPSDVCGKCECSNGAYNCFKTFDLVNDTNLDDDQLYTLKKDLIQVFNFQYNHDDHVYVDLRHILKHPAGVTASKQERILDWKFSHYNRNRDADINSAEQHIFRLELLYIFGCSKFNVQLKSLMDANDDNKITKPEWKAFFDLTTERELSVQPVKREALLSPLMTKKPLHLRKKFRYILH